MYGSDISVSNFPLRAIHRAFISIDAQSSEFTEEWSGKFVFINQRMLIGGLAKE